MRRTKELDLSLFAPANRESGRSVAVAIVASRPSSSVTLLRRIDAPGRLASVVSRQDAYVDSTHTRRRSKMASLRREGRTFTWLDDWAVGLGHRCHFGIGWLVREFLWWHGTPAKLRREFLDALIN